MKLIKFYGNACSGCDRLAITLENAFPEANEKIVKINLSEATGVDMALAINFGVMTTPTLLLIDDAGVELARTNGYMAPQVAPIIEQFMTK